MELIDSLPNGKPKEQKVAVVDHFTDSYMPRGSYYHVFFTDWANINNALGGKTTALKLDSVTNVFSEFLNPLFVCRDIFGEN